MPAPASQPADVSGSPAHAVHETILYNFRGRPDGWDPDAGLVFDNSGALYGTTLIGGKCSGFYYGCGTVFKLTPSGSHYVESVIYRFAGGNDGEAPAAPVVVDSSGRVFGTTYAGGGSEGRGTVFMLTPSGSGYAETVIHSFSGYPRDGTNPFSGLAIDRAGNIFGTAQTGGSHDAGVVFELSPSGSGYTETIVHNFGGPGDGSIPMAAVTLGTHGVIYGVAGAIFKLTPSGSGYAESILYRLRGGIDGKDTTGTLLLGKDGALYGTAQGGGPGKGGTVFRLTPEGSKYAFTVLHHFGIHGGRFARGAFPQAGVISDSTGSLYGTTYNGGNWGCSLGGCGVVFKLTPSKKGYFEEILWSFHNNGDGNLPFGGVVEDSHGTLYGTTGFGGQTAGTHFYGTVFRITR
ncbi:MAG: hypothetical protein JO104_12270 [Candidatus Eremiobacteraeota bacterium]|nr:hypothetical protein [Candidatus Eremiobacteraeota bacterium]